VRREERGAVRREERGAPQRAALGRAERGLSQVYKTDGAEERTWEDGWLLFLDLSRGEAEMAFPRPALLTQSY